MARCASALVRRAQSRMPRQHRAARAGLEIRAAARRSPVQCQHLERALSGRTHRQSETQRGVEDHRGRHAERLCALRRRRHHDRWHRPRALQHLHRRAVCDRARLHAERRETGCDSPAGGSARCRHRGQRHQRLGPLPLYQQRGLEDRYGHGRRRARSVQRQLAHGAHGDPAKPHPSPALRREQLVMGPSCRAAGHHLQPLRRQPRHSLQRDLQRGPALLQRRHRRRGQLLRHRLSERRHGHLRQSHLARMGRRQSRPKVPTATCVSGATIWTSPAPASRAR